MSIFSQLNFKHGTAKLQSASSSLLCLTGNDGGNILVQDAISGNYMPVALSPFGINQELFNGTAHVEGVANQTLTANTLYSVYLKNPDGIEANSYLEFWRTFSGFNPTIDPNGLYVGNTGGINISLMYVGQIWTGNSDISTIVALTAHLKQPCYSHFNPWHFGFQTTTLTINSFTQANNGVQNGLSILSVTEGISECFEVSGFVGVYGVSLSASTTIQYQIQVSGTCINGSGGSAAWTSLSPAKYLTIPATSQWVNIEAEWMSAPPIGVYVIQPVISLLNPATCIIQTALLGKLSL